MYFKKGKFNMAKNKNKGKLVGFLVAYDDDVLGESYELREGRYIIKNSDQTLQKNDILVQKQGVDSPHLAINVTADNKIQVQDIFSKEGTYYLKESQTVEKRLIGIVSLKHGDRIRIGNCKNFQVCMLANE